jgi:hypothetical protein
LSSQSAMLTGMGHLIINGERALSSAWLKAPLGGSPTHLVGSVTFLPSRCRPPHTRRTVLVGAAS